MRIFTFLYSVYALYAYVHDRDFLFIFYFIFFPWVSIGRFYCIRENIVRVVHSVAERNIQRSKSNCRFLLNGSWQPIGIHLGKEVYDELLAKWFSIRCRRPFWRYRQIAIQLLHTSFCNRVYILRKQYWYVFYTKPFASKKKNKPQFA